MTQLAEVQSPVAALDPEIAAYFTRVKAVREAFDKLGRGSRMQASHDLRLGSSTVSSTVNGTVRNIRALEKLEGWVKEKSA